MSLSAAEAREWKEFPQWALPMLRDAICLVGRATRGEMDAKWETQAEDWDRAARNLIDEDDFACKWCTPKGEME